MHNSAQLEERPALQNLLAELDREQLQTLLVCLVEQQPYLADVVEGQVHVFHVQPTADAPTPRQRRTLIDSTRNVEKHRWVRSPPGRETSTALR